MISGLMAGLGGVIFAARLNSVDLNAGGGTLLLDAISAAVIGGTSLFGGRGRVISALMGALVISTVANGIDLLGYSSAIKYMVTGLILLAAVTLDTVSRRRLTARRPLTSGVRTSLGIWALGLDGDALRAGRLPAGARRRDDRRSGCAAPSRGSSDLIDDYEFHYPGELSGENLDEVREALDGHGIYTICTGLHLDPRFGRGGLVSPDPATRAEARRLTRETAELAGRGRRAHGLLARDRGLQLPVPDARTRSRGSGSSTASPRPPRSARSTGGSSSSSTRTPSRR